MEMTAEFLEAALQAMKQEIMSSLHVAMPGIIQAYDALAQTATVQPAILRSGRDGKITPAPLLAEVPVFRCGGGADPAPGSMCLLIFADFCMDGFFETGQPAVPPSPRMHDLSDAWALVR